MPLYNDMSFKTPHGYEKPKKAEKFEQAEPKILNPNVGGKKTLGVLGGVKGCR